MQARLPDVNTAFIKHRNGVIEGLGSQNWDKVFGSLYSWNALLPRITMEDTKGNQVYKYRIYINTKQYEELTKVQSEALCNKCDKWTDYAKIKIFNLINSLPEQVLTMSKTSAVWICPKCKTANKIKDTTIAETKLKEPYFLGVVPSPPSRKDGLQDRGQYARAVKQWAWNFINELEEKSTAFREDYRENSATFEDYDNTEGAGEED